MKHKREKQWMYKGNRRESVLEEVWWVVHIIRGAKVVRVRVWIMTEIVLGLTNCLQETGYAPEDAQRVRLLLGIHQVQQRPPTTPTITICTSSLQA